MHLLDNGRTQQQVLCELGGGGPSTASAVGQAGRSQDDMTCGDSGPTRASQDTAAAGSLSGGGGCGPLSLKPYSVLMMYLKEAWLTKSR